MTFTECQKTKKDSKMKTAKIDKLGRVVIPIQYRRELGLCEGSEINLRCCERKIIIVPKEPTCRICGGELKCSCEIALCEGCIQMVKMLK